jgi:hypothetical protein
MAAPSAVCSICGNSLCRLHDSVPCSTHLVDRCVGYIHIWQQRGQRGAMPTLPGASCIVQASGSTNVERERTKQTK